MNAIRRRDGVDDDIFEAAAYIARRSTKTAYRFIDAVEESMRELARMPKMGSRKEFEDPALTKVRTWLVAGFPNHLIYYFPMQDGIDVLAVMHGAQLPEAKLCRRTKG